MKKINLASHGFVRTPEDDFRDDGNVFRGYRYNGMKVSYCRYQDDAYISTKPYIEDKYLPYEVYSKLPCFREIDHLNGMPISSISEISLEALKMSIDTYKKAYLEKWDEIHGC